MKNEKQLGLRIEDELLKKFNSVCRYEGRSVNGQLHYLIRKCVAEYGEIIGEENDTHE